MNNLFPPELRTASVVQRWSIVRTLNPDSVANHSFFVIYYALAIARLIDWQGPLADLTFVASMHDAEEFITGDLVSPVKHAIIDEGKYANFVSQHMKERLPLIATQLEEIMESKWGDHIEAIVKVADKVDAAIFLILEQRMGNAVLEPLYQDAVDNLYRAWEKLSEVRCSVWDVDYRALWSNELYPAIQAHWKHGSVGLQ